MAKEKRQGSTDPRTAKPDPLGAEWFSTAWAFDQADLLRRFQGILLDCAGLGPAETPFRILHEQAGLRLRSYGAALPGAPAVLLIPAPIKRCYIWDLAPHVSVVRSCLQQGMRVYLAEWLPPEKSEEDFGLDDYADRLLSACLDAIESDAGQRRTILVAHSLGGTFAAIFSCLYPQRVRSLVLLEAPLHFATATRDLAPLIAAVPDAAIIPRTFGHGHVPGSFLNLAIGAVAVSEFQRQRYVDLLACAVDGQALTTHMQVERWMLDEFPLPGKLFSEIIDFLYRDDRLMQGQLRIRGKLALPRNLTVPLLSVLDPRSNIAPPDSMIPFHQAAAGSPKRILTYEGDIGVAIQHVGVLIGRSAHNCLWPVIFEWLATA